MSLTISTGLVDYKQRSGCTKRVLAGGVLGLYNGAKPASANDAPNGSLLMLVTLNSAAHTPETRATGTVTLTGGASGSVDTITVNSVPILPAAVPYNASLTQTAADVAAAINAGPLTNPHYRASSAGAVITITADYGTGTGPNGLVVASTTTTLTKTDANMAGGIAAVNGLTWGDSVAGVLSKSGVWSGVGLSTDAPTYYRYARSAAALAGASTTEPRIDGTIALSGADLNLNPNQITNGVTQTIDTFTYTEPVA